MGFVLLSARRRNLQVRARVPEGDGPGLVRVLRPVADTGGRIPGRRGEEERRDRVREKTGVLPCPPGETQATGPDGDPEGREDTPAIGIPESPSHHRIPPHPDGVPASFLNLHPHQKDPARLSGGQDMHSVIIPGSMVAAKTGKSTIPICLHGKSGSPFRILASWVRHPIM